MESKVKLFEDILAKCPEKKIQSCAKKMIKNPEITGQATASVLCDLAYWLYIYGYEKEALEICDYSHLSFPQPGQG